MSHILLRHAKRVASPAIPRIPSRANYDSVVGVWRLGEVMLARDPAVIKVSKKEDIETGEDLKGE